MDLITLNLAPVVPGCTTAIRRILDAGTGGAIVNVSSHQAQRTVRGGPLPYATAKAAIEGLTRAVAVDYGHAQPAVRRRRDRRHRPRRPRAPARSATSPPPLIAGYTRPNTFIDHDCALAAVADAAE